jgi:hypothetical protein
MNLPAFTAEFSLYRSRNSYRVATAPDISIPAQSVVPALTYEDNVNCARCENKCNEQSAECAGYATASWLAGLLGCAVSGPLYPICAGGVTTAYATANAICIGKLAFCHAVCNASGESCCPVFCGGHCCSKGETCLPDGCCPSNRQVCGGECCPNGYSCCGDTCCPPSAFCRDDGNGKFCSDVPGNLPSTPSPPPPPNNCLFGGAPCGSKCCPPGLECCGVFNGQPDCRTSCLR